MCTLHIEVRCNLVRFVEHRQTFQLKKRSSLSRPNPFRLQLK